MPVINSGCSASVCIPWLSICPWGTVSFIIVGCPVKCLDHGIYSVNAECVNGWYTLNSLTFIWYLFSTGVLITFSYHRILFLKIFIYLAVLSLSCSIYRIFSCGMWDLVPWPGIEPGPPALGARSLSHWTTREVLVLSKILNCLWDLNLNQSWGNWVVLFYMEAIVKIKITEQRK